MRLRFGEYRIFFLIFMKICKILSFFSNAAMAEQVDCLLCSKTMSTRPEVRTHIFTKLHKDRAEQCHAKFQLEYYQADARRQYQ